MLQFEDPLIERRYGARHAAAHIRTDAAVCALGLATGLIAVIRLWANPHKYPAWICAWAAVSTLKNVAVLTFMARHRRAWLAWRERVVSFLRIEDQVTALVGSALVLGPMENTPAAPPLRVFILTILCFGGQWPYLALFTVGRPVRTRTAVPLSFAALLALILAVPHNFGRLTSTEGVPIDANPLVQAWAAAVQRLVRAGGSWTWVAGAKALLAGSVSGLAGGGGGECGYAAAAAAGAADGTPVPTAKQAVVLLWWACLYAAFWGSTHALRKAELADRAAFAAEVAAEDAAGGSGSGSSSPSSSCLPPLPRVVDLFRPLTWVFAVVPLLVMLDAATPPSDVCG